jgi:hypothetical protein
MQLELNTSLEILCLIGDDAFPLMDNLIQPFSHKARRKFVIKLSQACYFLEWALGILDSCFEILLG